MTLFRLVLSSFRFHARSHGGALLGAAVGTAVLVGALVVGDSVRESLRELALARLGKINLALAAGDRFFRAELGPDLAKSLANWRNMPVAAVFQLPATGATGDGSARANHIQVIGVGPDFWQLGPDSSQVIALAADEVVLNDRLAEQLRVKAGESPRIRVAKPSSLSRDAPISPQEDSSVALRVKIKAVIGDRQFGRFSLQASQLPPFNAFVSLPWLQERLGFKDKANLLLVGESGAPGNLPPRDLVRGREAIDAADKALRAGWQLSDAELELRELPERNAVEIRTSRVFLDPPVAEAALGVTSNATGILTYFVNELRVGGRATPYSMVAAMGAPIVPPDLKDNEILINDWLATDLAAKPGDELKLAYYVVGSMRQLEERAEKFTVRGVLPINGPAGDRSLMPDFPGLANAKNCRDWDAGFPIALDRIRDQDNKYWEEHRGTPKAFVTLATGQKLWGNRFGNLTAVRYSLPPDGAGDLHALRDQVGQGLQKKISPASVGLSFLPVREQALAAVDQAQDFGGLFIGFSFFLIVAALLLMSLLFQFSVEQRAVEIGALLALGFTPKRVRRLFWLEGGLLAVIGGVLGAVGGIGYAQAMVRGLATIWRDAVQTSALEYHAQPATVIGGAIGGVLVAWITIWFALRKQFRQPARELLANGAEEPGWKLATKVSRGRLAFWIAAGSTVAAVGMLGVAMRGIEAAGMFFGAGGLLLVAGLAAAAGWLAKLSRKATSTIRLADLGWRNAARRRQRSLAVLGLLACGSFLVVSVGANRLNANVESSQRSAGTGGFALIGESSLPVVQDLNAPAGREFYNLDAKQLGGVSVVPFRVRDGEDASCLNLNRAQRPRLLGVRPELLAERKAFTFADIADGVTKDTPWLALNRGAFYPAKGAPLATNEVAAIGDAASIQWALGKSVGDTIDFTDERGQPFKLRIVGAVANSILQGSLVISEADFVARFPNESGYRMFLIDAPSNAVTTASATLAKALQGVGMELTPATRRLAAFNAVQNTYLSTFQVLGGLGLLLGSAGLGVVVLRNVLERRGELAVLLAVGFRPGAVKWLVLAEHAGLLILGLGIGVVTAVIAVLPAVSSPGAEVPVGSLALTVAAVLVSGLVWTWLASTLALRGKLLDGLRNN